MVFGISTEDLQLLQEFFVDKLTHDRGMAGEIPLKDCIVRLQELLGVKME